MTITKVPSPNFFPGRKTWSPITIVIHIMEGSLSDTDSWFQSKESKVSAHYGVGKNGEVHQYVEETDSAWHAGRVYTPSWPLIQPAGNGLYYNPNYYTVGIEHEGDEQTEWTDATYAASSALIRDISARWHIPLDRNHVAGHHEIFARKACPGNRVDLLKLIALASASAPVPTAEAPIKILQLRMAMTTVRLNLRAGPNRNHAPVTTVDAGTRLAFDGFTEQGEPVSGNSKWFYTAAGEWFWGGGIK
jgi:N-acetylmuramoyl-L-alanine amidase